MKLPSKKHLWIIPAYAVFYLASFFFIEQLNPELHILDSSFDQLIPFCEYFIYSYISWFFLIAITLYFFSFIEESPREFYAFTLSMALGMTLFIVVSLIYPNGHTLRPELAGDSLSIMLVRLLYWIDTPTNILPSIHVYVAVVCGIALMKNQRIREHKALYAGVFVVVVLIILATLFLKQHTIIDVITALMLNVVSYYIFYIKTNES